MQELDKRELGTDKLVQQGIATYSSMAVDWNDSISMHFMSGGIALSAAKLAS